MFLVHNVLRSSSMFDINMLYHENYIQKKEHTSAVLGHSSQNISIFKSPTSVCNYNDCVSLGIYNDFYNWTYRDRHINITMDVSTVLLRFF